MEWVLTFAAEWWMLWYWCFHGLGPFENARMRRVSATRAFPRFHDPKWAFPLRGKYDDYDTAYPHLAFTYRRFKNFSYHVSWKQLGEYGYTLKRRGRPG